ncbi:MAG: alpha/beta hydrolase [Dermatophilus congolensis]|nr:alpha/beta hydrolase [Dermatophilus congolensis]
MPVDVAHSIRWRTGATVGTAAFIAAALLAPPVAPQVTASATVRANGLSNSPDIYALSPQGVESSSPMGVGAGEALRDMPRRVGAGVSASLASAPALSPMPARPASIGRALRWRQYLAQRPVWRASTCSPEVASLAADITAPRAVVECATVRTPLDWSDLTAGSITLAVARVRDSRSPVYPSAIKPANRRMLLVNPGGPGVVADWLAPSLAARSGSLLATHDIVAVDPRGTGGSTPIVCPVVHDGVADLRTVGRTELATMQQAVRDTVNRCAAANGRLLRHISTEDMAGDLDLVRRLLGRATTDFYGVSAGTWLGAKFAQQYPKSVGRFVLDGNTDFSATWRESFAGQPLGFQRRLEQQFYPWAARYHRAYGLGSTPAAVKATFERVRSAVADGRLPELTPREFDSQTVESLYQDAGFLTLAESLRDLRRRAVSAPGGAVAAPSGQPGRAPVGEHEADPSETVFMAVQCNDSGPGASPASYADEGRALGGAYPLLGYEWLTSPCAYWPWPAAPTSIGNQAATRPLPAMLMVQTEFDPATPLEGALRAHRANPATRLVGVEDQGSHGAYLSENACVTKTVNTYLAKGTLPAKDMVCPGLPLPRDTRTYPVGGSLAAALR